MNTTEIYKAEIAFLDNGEVEEIFFQDKNLAMEFIKKKFEEIKKNFRVEEIHDDYSEKFLFWKGIENFADVWGSGKFIRNYSHLSLEKFSL